jgi:hypothetical protein
LRSLSKQFQLFQLKSNSKINQGLEIKKDKDLANNELNTIFEGRNAALKKINII